MSTLDTVAMPTDFVYTVTKARTENITSALRLHHLIAEVHLMSLNLYFYV